MRHVILNSKTLGIPSLIVLNAHFNLLFYVRNAGHTSLNIYAHVFRSREI